MKIDGFIIKKPSKNSKGIIYLGDDYSAAQIPREKIIELKKNWYFFWYHLYKMSLKQIPHNDHISVFVCWDDIINELKNSERQDYFCIKGGSETFTRHDLLFYPITEKEYEYDLIYVSRFFPDKRCDMMFNCVQYLIEHDYPCKALFLENFFQNEKLKENYLNLMYDMKLENYIEIKQVAPDEVNKYFNKSKLSLFTSDIEGLCRAVVETLLAERPILAYKETKALTQTLYDKRFFYFYDFQTKESIGEAALKILKSNNFTNKGARQYILKEKRLPFMDLAAWVKEVTDVFKLIFEKNKEDFNESDLVQIEKINKWENIRLLE